MLTVWSYTKGFGSAIAGSEDGLHFGMKLVLANCALFTAEETAVRNRTPHITAYRRTPLQAPGVIAEVCVPSMC